MSRMPDSVTVTLDTKMPEPAQENVVHLGQLMLREGWTISTWEGEAQIVALGGDQRVFRHHVDAELFVLVQAASGSLIHQLILRNKDSLGNDHRRMKVDPGDWITMRGFRGPSVS